MGTLYISAPSYYFNLSLYPPLYISFSSPQAILPLLIPYIPSLPAVTQADPVYPDIAIKPKAAEVEAVEEEEEEEEGFGDWGDAEDEDWKRKKREVGRVEREVEQVRKLH